MKICDKLFRTGIKLPSFNFLAVFERKLSSSKDTDCDKKRNFDLPSRFAGQKPSVWEVYAKLALKHKPLDLGQGFPDYAPPKHVTKALAAVANGDDVLIHQYTRGMGHPRLVKAISKLYSQLICRNIDPYTEVLITVGAYESLFSTILGHVECGDEVIIVEPFFDCYEPMVHAAGGTPKFIPLRFKPTSDCYKSTDWALDSTELRNMFNSKTKLIIVNTPNNPVGKVYTYEELEEIACLCKEFDVLCISDEVYEWLVFHPNKHIRMATLPGMWDRTITIGSAGKTFGITGWKLGWSYGPAKLMHNLKIVHQTVCLSCSAPTQEALAIGFEVEIKRFDQDDCYFKVLACDVARKKEFMCEFLSDIGMKPVVPDGGFFLIADWTPLESEIDLSGEKDEYKDYRFTKWLIKNVGVQGIPPTCFYGEEDKKLVENFVRFCFIKKDEKLEAAAKVLKKWRNV